MPSRFTAFLILFTGSIGVLWFVTRGAQPRTSKVYVVQKVEWRYVDRAEPYHDSEPLGAGYPVKVFRDRTAAEAFRVVREREERKGRCPFEYGRDWGQSFPSLADFTSTPTGEFLDWLEARGLSLPPGQREAWRSYEPNRLRSAGLDRKSYGAWWTWWDTKFRGHEGDLLCDRIWDKLDRVRFYEVVEVDSE